MEAKVGDRVSLDAKKVGQPRRTGVIKSVTQGLSGARYQIRWDDGSETVIAPGAGNLTVEGRTRNPRIATKAKTRKPKRKPVRAKAAKRKPAKRKPAKRKPAKRKPAKRKPAKRKAARRR